MSIELTPELGIEITPDMSYVDLRERAAAACRTIELLEKHGLQVDETPADKEAAAKLTAAYAEDPARTSKLVNTARAAALTPAVLRNIRTYLDEYGRAVVVQALEVRHLVTNRLLEESQNPDPRIRIRALELLGKHSDVGLFSDRSEVTITHQTTDELKAKLRDKLRRLVMKNASDEPVTIEMQGDVINVDEELGLKTLEVVPATGTDPQ